jgi:hypothetical protein
VATAFAARPAAPSTKPRAAIATGHSGIAASTALKSRERGVVFAKLLVTAAKPHKCAGAKSAGIASTDCSCFTASSYCFV